MLNWFSNLLPTKRSSSEIKDAAMNEEVSGIPLPATTTTTRRASAVARQSSRRYARNWEPTSYEADDGYPPTSHSLADFDVVLDDSNVHGQWHYPYPPPSQSRSGPSNVEWISSSGTQDDELDDESESFPVDEFPSPPPPAVIRVGPQDKVFPIVRSVSSPPSSSPHDPLSSDATLYIPGTSSSSHKWNLRLNTNPAFSQSTHSLRLDNATTAPYVVAPATTATTDVYGHAYNYPLAKQLSPIAEQDYFSPTSLRSSAIPGDYRHHRGSALSVAYSISNATNPSPGGSQTSEITRPSPSFASLPFITRQLNRTISQTSSHTHVSTTSTVPRVSLKSASATGAVEPPLIPPLNLAPPFPGPHPSRDGPPLRPRRSAAMPTIPASTESAGAYFDEDEDDNDDEYSGVVDDLESLHAESFVTASDKMVSRSAHHNRGGSGGLDMEAVQDSGQGPDNSITQAPSPHSMVTGGSSRHHSASDSFISRRWERDAGLGSGVVVFRVKRQWMSYTPAFWAFWLGFVCPFLWLVGGWHFTHFGEQSPKLTFWEFYFNTRYWKVVFCCGYGKRRKASAAATDTDTTTTTRVGGSHSRSGESSQKIKEQPRLPRWVTEKQSSDDGRMRLQDVKRSLRGIHFGYPFIPRPVIPCRSVVYPEAWRKRVAKRVVHILEKPNRLFDHLHGVKLREVRGRPESGRRIFDPWIQRCRYALCYVLVILCVGLCTTCTYLIVFSTR